MTGSALYSRDILRLAAALETTRIALGAADSAEVRSPACGSVMRAVVALDGSVIRAVQYDANACALGQAAAALVQARAPGRDVATLEAMRADIAALLAGDDSPLTRWPELAPLVAARAHPGRHGSIMLAIEAPLAALRAIRSEAA